MIILKVAEPEAARKVEPICTILSLFSDACLAQAPPRTPLSAEQRERIETGLEALQKALDEARDEPNV